jgi:hypothetical protein
LSDPSDQTTGTRRFRWSLVGIVIAALVPATAIAAGFLITAGGGPAAPTNTGAFQSVVQQPAPPVHHGESLPPGSGALVALVMHKTTMRVRPGGPALAEISTHTEFGSPTAFWVVRHSARWLGVVSSTAGNGHIGWILRSATSLGRVHWQIRVSLSTRRLSVIEDGKVRRRYTVAVGRPDAPTPTGRFAVTDRLATHDPSGPYGCCILALSAHSPHAIQGWGGGNRIAIHSTPDTGSIGQPVSHGCMRLTLAEGQWLLGHIPLGTPTVVST